MNLKSNILDFLFLIVFVLGGILCIFVGSKNLVDGVSSNEWAWTEGEVVDSKIVQTGRGNSKEAGRKYKPKISYIYNVRGRDHYSDRIVFGTTSRFRFFSSSKSAAESWVRKYPSGSKIKIFYNPSDETESVILNGFRMSSLFLPFLGVLLLFAGIFSKSKGKKTARRRGRQTG